MAKVSVILPTYNGAATIEVAIKSVLSQTWRDLELIIVDDGSTDGVGEVIKSFSKYDLRVKYLRNDNNIGLQASLNRGLRAASGKFIARIDDDDEWICSDKLSRQIDFLMHNSDHVLVGTGFIIVRGEGKEIGRCMPPLSDEEIRKVILHTNCFAHPSVVFMKEAINKVGEYWEGPAEDYDMWLKLGKIGKFANINCYCLKYMVRPNSASRLVTEEINLRVIELIKMYRYSYPNFWPSIINGYWTLAKYRLLKFIPPGPRIILTQINYYIKNRLTK